MSKKAVGLIVLYFYMEFSEVVDELKRCAGIQFDPDLVEKFISMLEGNFFFK